MSIEDFTRPDKDLLEVRSVGVSFYVIRASDELFLIDTGFIGSVRRLNDELARRGWDALPIRGILLTHGHLDHILNAARFARRDGAWIAAPTMDAEYYLGRSPGVRKKRLVDVVEGIGRRVLQFESFLPDRWIEDGETIDIWHGLRAVHLPGHTTGHTGYYCEALGLLFCGDLFSSFGPLSHRPPDFFNADSELAHGSIERALALNLRGALPHHCVRASPREHLEQLRRLGSRR